MDVFRWYQAGRSTITDVSIKDGDKSLATVVDARIEGMLLSSLSAAMPDIAIYAEEGGAISASGSLYMYIDPCDGTREMTTETSLSVIIIGLMERATLGVVGPEDRLVGSLIAEPSTGRIWAATSGGGCHKYIATPGGGCEQLKKCNVWEGRICTQTSVFIDSSQGYVNTRDPNNRRWMLTDTQNAKLYSLLNSQTHVRVLGPNGQIEALVANGARGVAGSMSLALGWPWDAVGALLVLEAGGSALAYSVTKGSLRTVNPMLVNDYDFLVCANDKGNADWLASRLISTLFP
jgi:fructose-1,6-bisphosphatase/inositol monophosphatase family enzyme